MNLARHLLTRLRTADWPPVVVYACLATAILGPALGPGYILRLDMVVTPEPRNLLSANSLLPFNWLLNLLGSALPTWLVQKLLLLTILFLAGLGLHRLLAARPAWPGYVAGTFSMINPFTYGRLLAGQYLVLAGYALLPWLVRSLQRWRDAGSWRSTAVVGGWLIIMALLSLHNFGFGLILTAITAGAIAIQHRGQWRRLRRRAAQLGAIAAGLLVSQSFWLIPLLRHQSTTAQLLDNIDDRHFFSFRTLPDALFGLPLNVLGLYGFWADGLGQYRSPKTAAWLVVGAVIVGLALWGLWQHRRERRFTVMLLAAAGLLGWALALGPVGSPLAGINRWLLEHLPGFNGYREPGKWIALVALATSYGLGLAALSLSRRLSRPTLAWARGPATGLLLVLPLLYTPGLLWAAGGQLRAVEYPADWSSINARLRAAPDATQVLFLPWHEYMYFGFAGTIIANPAPAYFDRPTIAGDNPEIGLVTRQSTNPRSTYIEHDLLDPVTGRVQLGARLRTVNIEYVLLAREDDYADYAWLDHSPDLRLIQATPTLRLYHNEAYTTETHP